MTRYSIRWALLGSLVASSSAFAADRLVPQDYPTIQAAVNAAANGDVIRVTGPSIAEHGIIIDNRTVTIEGIADAGVTVDAQQLGRHLQITGSSEVELRNLRFVNGRAQPAHGGAIFFEGSSLTLEQCVFESNQAKDGGAVVIRSGRMRVVACRFFGNQAIGGPYPFGGALRHIGGEVVVTRSRFSGNYAGYHGGAISHGWGYLEGSGAGPLRIISCVLDANTSSYGGALHTYQGSDNVICINAIFSNNGASIGRAIVNYCGRVRMVNSVVIGSGSQFHTYYGGGVRGLSCITSSGGLVGYNNVVADPMLSSDFVPQEGSPCIDAGTPLRLVSEFLATGTGSQCSVFDRDYLGNPRISDVAGVPNTGCFESNFPIDIGAVEVAGLAVTRLVVGDLDDSGQVDGKDLAIILSAWGIDDCGSDINADGVIDGIDLSVLIAAWGDCTIR